MIGANETERYFPNSFVAASSKATAVLMKRDLWGRGGGQRGGTEGQEGDVAARVIRHFFLFLSRDTTGSRASSHRFGRQVLLFLPQAVMQLLGGSRGVVNSLDFCPASLKSRSCFNFRCVLSSQWKAVTVNLRIFYTANF